jgi:hypothetical protein
LGERLLGLNIQQLSKSNPSVLSMHGFWLIQSACLFVLTSAQLLVVPDQAHQIPMAAPANSKTQTLPLADLLGRNRQIQIFSGLIQDVDSVSQRLADVSQRSIVLAPANSAMTNLGRKPWENKDDYTSLGADAYAGQDGKDRADANLKTFVEEHIVPANTLKDGEKVQTLSGKTIWLEKNGDNVVVCNHGLPDRWLTDLALDSTWRIASYWCS